MEKMRCSWGNSKNPLYQKYHDKEWGKLNLDSTYLYEMLVLESFQSGLSWETILNKRENFKKAFANFDYHKVAKFNENDFERLMQDKGIVRNRLKINAAINNAKMLVKLEKENQTLGEFLTQFIPKPIMHHPRKMEDVSASDDLSKEVSKEMKKLGFKFVGPVTIYSFLQAIGLINDHLENCSFKNGGL
ncbi:DNA-3-methyladenine glycosylase I [Lactobacillus johnsonii]|uniref:DNA-3-methyladenine glycosylase I n=1 Tax=Lactobacillus johnsonii TaxID=33959 RepID=UPI0028EAFEDB|nr:DNA-3-methyladenine glycosylase I [Lactobacillus johnsonii]MDT9604928.1 DNA-3-methyladenine glycosylase I [Lactobacillus johnsonii]